MKIAKNLIELFGKWSNVYWPDYLVKKISALKQRFYVGRLKPRFKQMEGWINGRITLNCPQYISVGKKSVIDDGMHNFCINRLINKLTLEKNRIDDEYINDLNNYKILT